MIQLQELKELVDYYGKDVIKGLEEKEADDFLRKVFHAVDLFKDKLPDISEDVMQDLKIRFEEETSIEFKRLGEISVVLKIFDLLLGKKEKEIESLNTPDRSRKIDGLFVYKSKFYRVMRLVQSKISEEESRVRTTRTIESLLKSYSLAQVKLDIERYDSFDEKIQAVDATLKSLHNSEYVKEYIPERIKGLELDLLKLRNELTIEKVFQVQKAESDESLKQDIQNMHLEVFTVNGFKLFDYLMKNHLTSTQQSDISFFFRMMERDGLIHGKQKLFKDFLMKEYPDLEPMGKIKLLVDVKSDWRQKAYSTAKNLIGLK